MTSKHESNHGRAKPRSVRAIAVALIAAVSVGVLSAPALGAERFAGPAEDVPLPSSLPAATHVTCEPIKDNPDLERMARETPPPPPLGAPPPEKPTRRALCPAGRLAVTTPYNPGGLQKRHLPVRSAAFGPSVTAKSSNEGYYYVGDIWEQPSPNVTGELFTVQLSAPVIPTTAVSGAHSLAQLAITGGPEGRYTIELGWIKEIKDQEERYNTPRPFFFVNPDNYGEKSCYNCGLVLAEGVTKNPFETHYHSTDGTPESECTNPNGVSEKPCSAKIWFAVLQYKGAWWLWFGTGWVGRVSDNMWGKHFKKGIEYQVYGEVFDDQQSPQTPMGNGNKGSCLCATAMESPHPWLKKHETDVEFHKPIQNESYPQRYTAGNITTNELHFGG